MEIPLHKTRLFSLTWNCKKKILVHEGGAGSSKTYSVLQTFLVRSFSEQGRIYTVVRKTGPALTRSARRDLLRIMDETDTAQYFVQNKTEGTYTNRLTGTMIELMALDDPMKAHGPRRDDLFINEANELSYEDYKALTKRTRRRIIIDYNPSFQRSWIYDHVLTRDDCQHVLSTYRDNSFLSAGERAEIEEYVPVYEEADGSRFTDWKLTYTGNGTMVKGDVYEWAVYGLGLRGSPSEAIYTHIYEGAFPESVPVALGLDFGYTHALSLNRVAVVDREGRRPALHVDEIFHEKYILNSELIEKAPSLGVKKTETIWCDSENPGAIQEWQNARYDARPCKKGPGSVFSQIGWVKGHDLVFTTRSSIGKAQHQDYRWKKRIDGTVLDEPVKLNDDGPDSVRYGAFNAFGIAYAPAKLTFVEY